MDLIKYKLCSKNNMFKLIDEDSSLFIRMNKIRLQS